MNATINFLTNYIISLLSELDIMQQRQYKMMQSLCCILVILTLSFAASLHQVELDEQHHQHHQCHLFHLAQYWLPSTDFVWPIIVQSVDRYIPFKITFISIIDFAANARAPPANL